MTNVAGPVLSSRGLASYMAHRLGYNLTHGKFNDAVSLYSPRLKAFESETSTKLLYSTSRSTL